LVGGIANSTFNAPPAVLPSAVDVLSRYIDCTFGLMPCEAILVGRVRNYLAVQLKGIDRPYHRSVLDQREVERNQGALAPV
jgi:hypothetical protein